MSLIRQYISYLTKKKAEEYLRTSKSIHPSNYDKKLIPQLSTNEVINNGIELMKKDGFKIATEEVVQGL